MTFAGFWRRLGAFAIDVILIGLTGLIAGFAFFDAFVSLGPWGRGFGFVVAFIYFGILNSRLAHGQTVGKRLLKIKVVGADGAPLSVPRALLRYIPLGAPWFLNGAQFPLDVLTSPLVYLLSICVFGLGLALVYLYFFNRPSHQVLHDLLVGSFVVRAESAGAVPVTPVRRPHLIAVAVLLVATAALPRFTSVLVAQEPFASMMQAYRAANAEPDVVYANVQKGWVSSGGPRKAYLQVVAYLSEQRVDDQALAKRLATAVIAADPSAMGLHTIQVILVYGYDIGIASSYRSQNYSKVPADWELE